MTQLIHRNRGTSVTFTDSISLPDVDVTLNGLAADAGRVSAEYDAGATASRLWEWRMTIQMNTAGVVGESVDLYLAYGDGTDRDGDSGAVDAALPSVNRLKNMTYIGSVVVQDTTTATDMTSSGMCSINSRYISVVVHNNTADALQATDGVNIVTLTPVADQIQADV